MSSPDANIPPAVRKAFDAFCTAVEAAEARSGEEARVLGTMEDALTAFGFFYSHDAGFVAR